MKKIIEDNYGFIKQCVNTTLAELYDLQDALDQANINDSKADTFSKVAGSYEDLRRRLIEGKLEEKDYSSIEVILAHRERVLREKRADTEKALALFLEKQDEIIQGLKN